MKLINEVKYNHSLYARWLSPGLRTSTDSAWNNFFLEKSRALEWNAKFFHRLAEVFKLDCCRGFKFFVWIQLLGCHSPQLRDDFKHLNFKHSWSEFVQSLICGLKSNSLPHFFDQLGIKLWLMFFEALKELLLRDHVRVKRWKRRNLKIA